MESKLLAKSQDATRRNLSGLPEGQEREVAKISDVLGIGTDLVELERFRVTLERTPGIKTRTFTEAERTYADKKNDPTERYAARWAAKEAVMKAMGVGLGEVAMHDIEVVKAENGAPSIMLHDTAAAKAAELGITQWKLTMTHTETLAQAIAVAL